jgi:uncharacterized protein YdhG (YjbR/CyaY superfamily)
MKVAVKTIDDYLALQSEKVMMALERIRQIIRNNAPGAEELISYGMPSFKIHGRQLVYFAAFKEHMSLFPANASLIEEMKKELKPYVTTKGSIHFTLDKPLPVALVKKIVKARVKQNLEKADIRQIKGKKKTK